MPGEGYAPNKHQYETDGGGVVTYQRKEVICDATLYLGDCLGILPTLEPVDAVVTDPPYGIADKWQGGKGHGWANQDLMKKTRNRWDLEPLGTKQLDLIVAAGSECIIWGGNYFPLPPSRCWYVWNKPERGFTLAEAELAWTNKDSIVRVVDANRSDNHREHPTQKPLKVMTWCVAKTKGQVIDPFMGSGTTGVACANLGRKFIGIEIEEKYFDIACERIAAAYAQGRLFA